MKTNINDISFSINGVTGELIPYCKFSIIEKFISYLEKNKKINNYTYDDFLNFLEQI